MLTPVLKVGIIMGSDSDLPVMAEAARVLDKLSIPYETRVISAHRTPREAEVFAVSAKENGFGVIIAGAGGAAHLAGVIAANTVLPVIGVPITSGLSGFDSLLATVQMPRGIPVACVAIGGAHNAGVLAAQILGVSNGDVFDRVAAQKMELAEAVTAKDTELREIGHEAYIKKHLSKKLN